MVKKGKPNRRRTHEVQKEIQRREKNVTVSARKNRPGGSVNWNRRTPT